MRAVIVTAMRNEGPFILEWLAHHMALGFTDFVVFSNDCDDGTDMMLDRLAEMGLIAHLDNPRKGDKTVQWRALQRARRHKLVKQSDWIYFTDVDEFLNIKVGDGRLPALFDACPEADGFALSWRMFGAGRAAPFVDEKMTAQFTRAAPERLLWPWRAVQYKSLFRNNGIYGRLGVHRPLQSDEARQNQFKWVDDNGDDLPRGVPKGATLHTHTMPRYRLAQINHYALGSAENFLVKRDRGRSNKTEEDIDLAYWLDRNWVNVEDTSIQRIWPLSDPILDDLRKDPVLGPLHDASVAWRKARLAELLKDTDNLYVLARILQIGPSAPLPMSVQVQMFQDLSRLRMAKHAAKQRAKAARN